MKAKSFSSASISKSMTLKLIQSEILGYDQFYELLKTFRKASAFTYSAPNGHLSYDEPQVRAKKGMAF